MNDVSGIVGTEFLPRDGIWGLCESGGDESAFVRETEPTSTDCARLPFAPDSSLRPEAKDARCCDRIDRFSSMGVKMLCCLRCGIFLMADAVSRKGWCGLSELGSGFGSMGAGGCGSCDNRRWI